MFSSSSRRQKYIHPLFLFFNYNNNTLGEVTRTISEKFFIPLVKWKCVWVGACVYVVMSVVSALSPSESNTSNDEREEKLCGGKEKGKKINRFLSQWTRNISVRNYNNCRLRRFLIPPIFQSTPNLLIHFDNNDDDEPSHHSFSIKVLVSIAFAIIYPI